MHARSIISSSFVFASVVDDEDEDDDDDDDFARRRRIERFFPREEAVALFRCFCVVASDSEQDARADEVVRGERTTAS